MASQPHRPQHAACAQEHERLWNGEECPHCHKAVMARLFPPRAFAPIGDGGTYPSGEARMLSTVWHYSSRGAWVPVEGD